MGAHYPSQRLSFNDSLCTVRYVGNLPEQQGEWLGVEWDQQDRGKHDGQYNNQRLFRPLSCSPICASFIRSTRIADETRSFLRALRYKYAEDEPGASLDKSINISGKVVEEIGFERIRMQQAALKELRVVVLDRLRIRGILSKDDVDVFQEDVAETCPKITELDLSCNLFEHWREVVEICSPLKELKCLKARSVVRSTHAKSLASCSATISGLRLNTVGGDIVFGSPKLTELHLNDCLLSSGQVSGYPNLSPARVD